MIRIIDIFSYTTVIFGECRPTTNRLYQARRMKNEEYIITIDNQPLSFLPFHLCPTENTLTLFSPVVCGVTFQPIRNWFI